MAKNTGGNDFVGIGLGLTFDPSGTEPTKNAMVRDVEGINKALTSAITKGVNPLKSALQILTKAVNDLQSTIASTKFDALTRGLDAVNQKTVVMAKNAKESAQSIDKAVDATTKKLADFFKIDEGTAKFKKLGEVVNQALQFDGVDKGVAKITKMKDMMVQVGNEVAKVNSKAATSLMANASPDLSNVKLFSIDKYKAEVERARKEYQKLLDSASKGNLGSASNITNLGKQFEGHSLFTQGNNPVPNNTLEFVKNLRKQIADLQRSTDNTINFNKLYDQAEKLQNKFGNLVPPVLKQRLDALTTTNWEDTIRGTAKFRQEIDRVKYAVDSLGLTLKDKGEKLWNGIAIPKTYVTNVNGVSGAYAQAVKEDRQREEIKASQYWAAIKNTENFDKRSIGMNTSIAQLARDYDTVIKKVQEFNRLNSTSMSLSGWDKLDNLNKITDFKGLSAAKNQMAELRKQFADFLREQRVDDVLGKRFEKMATDITRADATLATFKHNIEKMNKTFDNVTSRTVSNDPKLPAVTDARANLANVMATASVGAFTPVKAAEITEAIRKVQLAMQDFAQTGSRIKDSTGSPFDNLFKGIPKMSVDVQVMKQQIDLAVASYNKLNNTNLTLKDLDVNQLSKITNQLKQFGYTIDQTTGEIKKLQKASDQARGMFSWLPESLGGMAARLTEFYSLRTIIFAVSSQFRDATRSAVELNQAVHDILAISGESKDKFSEISDSIYNIAKNSRFTAQEVAGLMQVLAQAGVQAKDLPTVSDQVGKFATAVAADPKTAADLATTAMNVYNIKAQDMARVTNAMTAALNLSKLEAGGLATAFNYLAPQAAQLGISMEQTLGIVANMAQSGIKASTIGTGVSQLLKEFAAPKERLRNMLKANGLTPDDINPMKREFADIVQSLQDANVGVDELFQAMETRVGRAAVTAVNLSAESFRRMTASLTGTNAALIAYDKTMEGSKARMNQVKQTANEIASVVGNNLAPMFIAATQAVRGFLTGFGAFNGTLATTIVSAVGAGGAILALVKTSGMLASGFLAVTGSTFSFSTALLALRVALSGFSMGGILAALAGPQAAIFLTLAAVGTAVYAVGQALDSKRQKEEAANKATAEALDLADRQSRTYISLAHSNKEVSKAYDTYMKMLKTGTGSEKERNDLLNTHITDLGEHKAALNEYVKKGGPQSQYLLNLLQEQGSLRAIIALQRILQAEANNRVTSSVEAHNKRMDTYAADARRKVFDNANSGAAWEGIISGVGIAGARTSKQLEEQYNKGALPKNLADKITSDLAKVAESIKAQGTKLAAENNLLGSSIGAFGGGSLATVGIDDNGKAVFNEVPKLKNPTPSDKLTSPGGKGEPREHRNKFIADGLRASRDSEEAKLDSSRSTKDEIEAFFGEGLGRTTIEKLVKEEQDGKITLNQLTKTLKTLADIEEALAIYEGSRAKDQIDPKLSGAKKAREIESADFKQAEMDEQFAAQRAEKKRKLLDARVKEEEQLTNAIIKADETSAKKIAEAEKRNQEKIMQDGYRSIDERNAAYEAYLKAERIRLEQEALLSDYGKTVTSIEAIAQKRPTSLAEDRLYGQALSGMENYVAQGMKESTQAAGLLKHTGDMANYDIQLKTEQTALQNKQEANKLLERTAIGYQEIKNLQADALRNEEEYLKNQASIISKKWAAAQTAAEEARYEEELLAIENKRKKVNADLADLAKSQLANIADGAREAWNTFSNLDKLSKQLGSDLTNAFTNGLSSTVSNTFTTLFNPDAAKINELSAQIASLKTQKATLEADIATIDANTSKTPEEIKNLNEKKIALDQVNNSLAQQEAAVRKQKDAWSTFSEGLKGIMKTILQELQNYIAKLFVVWAVQKLVGLVGGLFGGSAKEVPSGLITSTGDYVPTVGTAATGGLILPSGAVQRFSNGGTVDGLLGGMVPLNMGQLGKDSVPAILEPGEVIIKKSSVDYYGADKLLALNQGKIAKFAEGGLVGSSSASSAKSAEDAKSWTLQIVNIAQGDQVPDPGQQATQIINVINNDIARKGPTYKTIKTAIAT